MYKPDPDVVEDTYYRLRGIFVAFRDSGDEDKVEQSSMAYNAYVQAFQGGVLAYVEVPVEDNPDALFKVTPLPIQGAAVCKLLEAEILKAREPNGLLDVKPVYGADELKNRT